MDNEATEAAAMNGVVSKKSHTLPLHYVNYFPSLDATQDDPAHRIVQGERLGDVSIGCATSHGGFEEVPPTRRNSREWTQILAPVRSHTRLRAWNRVPSTTRSKRSFSGVIMKRVGLPKRATNKTTVSKSAISRAEMDAEDASETRRIRRRLATYQGLDQDTEQEGRPLTKLEMTSIKLQAKAQVSQCIKTFPSRISLWDLRKGRRGHFVQLIPAKRRLNDAINGGNQLRTYMQCKVLSPRAAQPTFIPSAPIWSPVRAPSSLLKTPRASRRSPVLAHKPMLSPNDILRIPKSLQGTPSQLQSTGAVRSPTKKSPQVQKSVQPKARRISETLVELWPASTPGKAEPSPTKSASPPPSTPCSEKATSIMPLLSFESGGSRVSAPWKLSPAFANLDFTSQALGQSPFATSQQPDLQSPIKPIRRTANTPSRWSSQAPSTPRTFEHGTPGTNGSPTKSISTLFATPLLQTLTPTLSVPREVPQFDFGTTSPLFNSASWLNFDAPPEQPRVRRSNSTSRRRSEPLIRNCFRNDARRQTMSPRKLVFESDEVFPAIGEKDTMLENSEENEPVRTLQAKKSVRVAQWTVNSPTSDLMGSVQASPIKGNRRTGDQYGQQSRPLRALTSELSIDMRENPDIFSTRPGQRRSLDCVAQQMDDDADHDVNQASIVTNSESKLEVQFKISPSYASIVPPSQGEAPADHAQQTYQDEVELQSALPLAMDQDAQHDTISCSEIEEQTKPQTCEETETVVNESGLASVQPAMKDIILNDSPENDVLEIVPSTPDVKTVTQLSSRQREDVADHSIQAGTTLDSGPASVVSPNASFTPVNKRSQRVAPNARSPVIIPRSPQEKPTPVREVLSEVQNHDYDSPGRDYMREFIKRSRPKQLCTTETGSPIAPSTKRQPLGAKSPNTESPNKTKRKHEKSSDTSGSPLKKTASPDARKARHEDRVKQKKSVTIAAREKGVDDTVELEKAVAAMEAAEEEEDEAEMDNGASARRSSRIRNQDKPAAGAKSSIPTPIKIGRAGEVRSGSLNAMRNEQHDLTQQTRVNTRRNKIAAEYPAQYLARIAEQPSQMEGEIEKGADEVATKMTTRQGKTVTWGMPLAIYQEEKQVKPKVGSKSIPKPRTYGSGGIAKPFTRGKMSEDRARTARLAEHFGMVGNGTPAKPQRVTRSKGG